MKPNVWLIYGLKIVVLGGLCHPHSHFPISFPYRSFNKSRSLEIWNMLTLYMFLYSRVGVYILTVFKTSLFLTISQVKCSLLFTNPPERHNNHLYIYIKSREIEEKSELKINYRRL